jgi:DivIVA domain-containing protein
MTGEVMFENSVPAPRFGVALRGYDRDQVDGYVADIARWAAEAWGRITELESRLSELEGSEAPQGIHGPAELTIEDARRTVDQFVVQVDAKAAELEDAVQKGTRVQLDELRERVGVLENERRAAIDHLARLRESLGSVHDGPRVSNGHDIREADDDHVIDHPGRPVEAPGVVPEFSWQEPPAEVRRS